MNDFTLYCLNHSQLARAIMAHELFPLGWRASHSGSLAEGKDMNRNGGAFLKGNKLKPLT